MNRVAKHLMLIAVTVALTVPSLAAAPPQRSFSAARFGLELDGVVVGFVTGVEGGNIFSDVVKEPPGEDFFVKKHLAGPTARDIVVEFGAGLDPALYNWIKGSLQREYLPKNGAILMVDYDQTVRTRLEFERAQITQVTFPGLDASSKEALRFQIRITPSFTTLNRKAGGKVSSSKQTSQKLALASSFRLAIDGLDMSKTAKVDTLTVNLPFLIDPSLVCVECPPFVPPGPIDFPNVVATISAASAEPVYQWLEKFLIGGDNSDESEKTGSLDYLSANQSSSLFQLLFKGLGIFEVAPAETTNTDSIARVVVSMYCERMEFNFF